MFFFFFELNILDEVHFDKASFMAFNNQKFNLFKVFT